MNDRINKLLLKELKRNIPIVSTPDNGYYPVSADGMGEFLGFVNNFMRKYNIGKYLSHKKWGRTKTNQISNILRKVITPEPGDINNINTPKTSLQVYDKLRKDAQTKKFTNYDFQRVARTETSRMKSVYQLLKFKEAGIKYVKNVTKNDAKVSKICRGYANREFKIDYLLSEAGEKDRIPHHPNCFISFKTPILTINGYKRIRDIKVGDKVLTHKGRYKKVSSLIYGETDESYKININTSFAMSISVTGGHPILTNRGWVEVKNLTTHDKVIMLATRCKYCDKKIPYTNTKKNTFCNNSCKSKYKGVQDEVYMNG